MPRPSTKTLRNRLIGAGVLVILVIAMVLNTKFLTPAEVAHHGVARRLRRHAVPPDVHVTEVVDLVLDDGGAVRGGQLGHGVGSSSATGRP